MYQRIRLFFTVFLLALLCVVPVSANSAIKSWSGSDGNGVYTMEEDCPVVCLKEDLIFDIGSFPLDYFGSVEELSRPVWGGTGRTCCFTAMTPSTSPTCSSSTGQPRI